MREVVSKIRIGEEVVVSAEFTPCLLSPEQAEAQIRTSLVSPYENFLNGVVLRTSSSERDAAGTNLFQTVVLPSARSGLLGFAIRLLPVHADSISPIHPGIMKWTQAPLPVAELQAR
jgi:hypothetical protein